MEKNQQNMMETLMFPYKLAQKLEKKPTQKGEKTPKKLFVRNRFWCFKI